MSKHRKVTNDRVAGFWARFSPYAGEPSEIELRFPLVVVLSAVIAEFPPKLYENVENRVKRVLEKGGKPRT